MSIDRPNRPAPGRPREPRADHAIHAATLELMAEQGVHALRMDDLARRAGVGKATIYRRYSSKEELVMSAVGALIDEIEVPDTGSTHEDMLTLMRGAVEFYGDSPAAAVMAPVIDEMSRNTELAQLARDRFLKTRRSALRSVFERGIERGDLQRDMDMELALDVLAGPLFYRLLITGGAIDERLAENVVELIFRGFAPTHSPTEKDNTG